MFDLGTTYIFAFSALLLLTVYRVFVFFAFSLICLFRDFLARFATWGNSPPITFKYFNIMAKENINQTEQTATNVAEQTNAKRTRAEIHEGAELKRAEDEQKKREKAQARADISHTSELYKKKHNSLNNTIRTLLELCAEDVRTLDRVAWIAGVEKSAVQDTREFRKAYAHAIRSLSPFYSGDTPLFEVRVAENLYYYTSARDGYTVKDIFGDPLRVKLGAKPRAKRIEECYYRKDGSIVAGSVAEAEIEAYQDLMQDLAQTAKDARAKRKIEILAERSGARK